MARLILVVGKWFNDGKDRITNKIRFIDDKTIQLLTDETTIGRDKSQAVIINNNEVSREHARIIKQHNNYFLEDVKSKNGTRLQRKEFPYNNEVVFMLVKGKFLLHNGDLIYIDDSVVIKFEE